LGGVVVDVVVEVVVVGGFVVEGVGAMFALRCGFSLEEVGISTGRNRRARLTHMQWTDVHRISIRGRCFAKFSEISLRQM